MTKEEFLNECIDYISQWMAHRDAQDLEHIFNTFFSQNVVIPKGENRHPYADVLHEWVEGAILLADSRIEGIYNDRILEHCSLILDETHYRIKPQEPVYEYMWYTDIGETSWMTDDEAESKDEYWNRANETKRVRQ